MKYNPKINEWAARLPGFAALHPLAPDAAAQGTLELLWELEQWLAEISGMHGRDAPAGGRRARRADRHPDDPRLPRCRAAIPERHEVIVPDSSHGTNPATASMAGFKTVTVPSDAEGDDRPRRAARPRSARARRP